MTLKEIEQQINDLAPADKLHILQTLLYSLTDIWPGIEKTADVVGGDACIVRTRIPIWALERYRQLGWSDGKILENFPTLRRSDLAQAWAYIAAHQVEIESALREQEEA